MMRKKIDIDANLDVNSLMIFSSENSINSSTISIDPKKCIGCGICAEICPFGLIKKREKKYYIPNPDKCTECSACKRNCPVDAIRMKEFKGCGCLWDVKSREKDGPSGNCCG